MCITYRQISIDEIEDVFCLYRKHMEKIIDESIGWVDDFQTEGFFTKLQVNWFYWVLMGQEKIGFICLREREDNLYLYLFIILESSQRKGLGRKTMVDIKSTTTLKQKALMWSCLKNNLNAVKLYASLPGVKIEDDGLFYRYMWS